MAFESIINMLFWVHVLAAVGGAGVGCYEVATAGRFTSRVVSKSGDTYDLAAARGVVWGIQMPFATIKKIPEVMK